MSKWKKTTEDQSKVLYVRCGFKLHREATKASSGLDIPISKFVLLAVKEKLERMGINVNETISNPDGNAPIKPGEQTNRTIDGKFGTETKTRYSNL